LSFSALAIYAAAVAKPAGVAHAIELLRNEVEHNMAMLGAHKKGPER
jgi:isopentenyl diphosphate isomerase/L-lactate dehydrogenase-like FMN-dependent dehydrogenase